VTESNPVEGTGVLLVNELNVTLPELTALVDVIVSPDQARIRTPLPDLKSGVGYVTLTKFPFLSDPPFVGYLTDNALGIDPIPSGLTVTLKTNLPMLS